MTLSQETRLAYSTMLQSPHGAHTPIHLSLWTAEATVKNIARNCENVAAKEWELTLTYAWSFSVLLNWSLRKVWERRGGEKIGTERQAVLRELVVCGGRASDSRVRQNKKTDEVTDGKNVLTWCMQNNVKLIRTKLMKCSCLQRQGGAQQQSKSRFNRDLGPHSQNFSRKS